MKKAALGRFLAGLLCFNCFAPAAEATDEGLFPNTSDFLEFRSVQSEKPLDERSSLAKLPDGILITEVGFEKYERRAYSLHPSGTLTIEVISLKDAKGAYSLLTLLGKTGPAQGPPGDFVSASRDPLIFAQANLLVRIQGRAEEDLVARAARSISGRIKEHKSAPPLIAHLPRGGLDMSSLRYYLGPRSFAKHALALEGIELSFQGEAEIAQARYALEDQGGILSLVDFPTNALAEEYFERFSAMIKIDPRTGQQVYFRRTGSLIGVLAGSFEPAAADRILGSMNVTYSVRWILDKKSSDARSVWGVPGGLLGTVLRAIVLTGLICVLALCAGVSMGLFRFLLKGYAPNNPLDRPERTEIIRLKIDEN